MSSHRNSVHPANPFGRKPRVTVAQLFLRAVQRWQQRRAAASLWLLDDRLLDDIGMVRGDASPVAAKVPARPAP